MYCRNCGAQINDGAKFCESCGASQFTEQTAAPDQIQEKQPTKQPKKTIKMQKKQKYSCFAVCAILLISFIVLFIIAWHQTPIKNIQTSSTTAASKSQKYTVEYVTSEVRNPFDLSQLNIVVITLKFTNNSEDTISFDAAFDMKVFQNGVECLPYEMVDDSQGFLQGMEDVQAGYSTTIQKAFRLKDTESPVEYIVGGSLFDSAEYARGTINLK